MLRNSNVLKTITQEILAKLKSNSINSKSIQEKQHRSETETYQDSAPQDISHKSFYEQENEFYQDNKELASIMNLEESIARSDMESLDEVRRMLTNNCAANNTREGKFIFLGDTVEKRTTYEEDKGLISFIKGPVIMKDNAKKYENNLINQEVSKGWHRKQRSRGVNDFAGADDSVPTNVFPDISPLNANNSELLESFRSAIEQDSSIAKK
eukprot:TRINITY_DN16180_c0_g1_i2.p1 TRINITY_DN16180_c0_g1~~TRINITY_DN16180_c0_g1_i2.p1  ORF type:complete len:211 (-),score=41.49 TRINITY_DN16180_c0_g1_i2:164-796(-)